MSKNLYGKSIFMMLNMEILLCVIIFFISSELRTNMLFNLSIMLLIFCSIDEMANIFESEKRPSIYDIKRTESGIIYE